MIVEVILKDLEKLYVDKPNRLKHVFGVKDTALQFGDQFGLDNEKLELSSLLHDMTKYYTDEENIEVIKNNYDNAEEILKGYNKKILHAFSARVLAQQKYHIKDIDVLDSILNHTVGKPDMSIYEKVIFISDYIEPNRTYDSCVKVRNIAFKDIDLAVFIAIDDSIKFYEQKNDQIPEIAYKARSFYKKVLEER